MVFIPFDYKVLANFDFKLNPGIKKIHENTQDLVFEFMVAFY
mgnify:CR=1 FL=1